MRKKKVAKIPYEGYTLPPSSEKGGEFIDFNKVKTSIPVRKVKKIKKRKNE